MWKGTRQAASAPWAEWRARRPPSRGTRRQCKGALVLHIGGQPRQTTRSALPFAVPMASSLDLLSAEIDRLIDLCRKLADENAALRREREQWSDERKRLVERNDLARDRIETMIVRLKALEDGR